MTFLLDIELLGFKTVFDSDFYKLLFRFLLNLAAVTVIARYIYYPIARRKDYLFTYFLISTITFFLCFILRNNDLDTGIALGLFAIFGIIRYRTDAIPIKEMTYLFVVIGVSVVNALVHKKVSFMELIFTDAVVIGLTFALEKIWLLKHETRKVITYEKIDLIKPQHHEQLKQDLEERTGLTINRIEVGRIDFLRDTAQVKIYYYQTDQLHADENRDV